MKTITLQEIKDDQAKAKNPQIWYSSRGLWWTHSPDDLEQATEQGKIATQNRIDAILADPTVPDQRKEMIRAGHEQMKSSEHTIPTDPHGNPLYMFTEKEKAERWISAAEEKPTHFGRHGIDAFIKTHHRNNEGFNLTTWDQVNNLIDGVGA